jgi:dihydrolipoamide dehydrogenase
MRDLRAEHLDDTDAADRLRGDGVEIVRGVGRVLGPGRVGVGDRELNYRNLLISTGAAAVLPPISGLAEAEPWTSEDALTSAELPDRLVILGGGAIGCELAQVYATFGSDVVVVEALERVLAGEEPAVSSAAAEVLGRSGVRVVTGTAVERVTREGAQTLVHLADGQVLPTDRLLVATGRRPQVADLGLESLGIDIAEGRLEIGSDARVVGQQNVFAAGDVIGRLQFTHTANYAGRVVAANVLGGDARLDFSAIPRGVYIDPPVAGVGTSVKQAEEDGLAVVSATVQVGGTARAWLEGEGGVLVLVADKSSATLIGASALGPRADEWIAQVTLAIRARIPLSTLVDTVQPFPAVSEVLFPAYEQLLAKVS